MKKTNLYLLLLAASLGLGSCNDIQDFNLDYGSRTYTNDYRGVIDAIKDSRISLEQKLQLIKEAITDQTNTLAEKLELIEQATELGLLNLKDSNDANTKAILEQMKSDGIDLSKSNFPVEAYITPSAYSQMVTDKANGVEDYLYQTLKQRLTVQAANPSCCQWVTEDGGTTWYDPEHLCFTATAGANSGEIIVGEKVIEDGEEYFKVNKTYEKVEYTVNHSSWCTWPYLKNFHIYDAKAKSEGSGERVEAGPNPNLPGAVTTVTIYYYYNGSIVTDPYIHAECWEYSDRY